MTPADTDSPGPRSLLATLAAFAGLTVVVVLGSTIAGALARPPSDRPDTPVEATAPDADVLAFFGPLATGASIVGW
jgi:hypothetical protein